MSGRRREVVLSSAPGTRLDRALSADFADLDPRSARSLIEDGRVFLDGKRCRSPAHPIEKGARVVVHQPEPEPEAPSSRPQEAIRILYEDEDLIAVDKRPGEHVNETETSAALSLVERLRDKDAYAVHRLDRETSGVVVLAKGTRMAETLSRAFEERRTNKTYLAIVKGSVPDGRIDLPIAPDKRRTRARSVRAHGKPAQTDVRTIARAGELSSIEVHPLTGRTHQIRVHLSHLGAPIAGDALYGGPLKVRIGAVEIAVLRVMLHALALSVPVHGKTLTFSAPIPDDMRRIEAAGLPLGPVFS